MLRPYSPSRRSHPLPCSCCAPRRRQACTSLFKDVFDTDKNGLVDAYELIAGLAMASQMTTADRVDFIHSLYDFNGSGDLTKDEMTIMLRTCVCGCAKMDQQTEEPPVEDLEAMAERAFAMADKDASGEITRPEFDGYCYSAPRVMNFLEYWDGALAQAKLNGDEKWEDPEFPCDGNALFKNEMQPPRGAMPASAVEWLRPDEFMDDPQLWKGGIKAGDVVQGALGDCWFLSALAVMAAKPHLLQQLFVKTGQEKAGRYCVRLFKDGDWINVYVDDRIPCNRADQPIYCKSQDPDEFWPCLVEKAYAKVHGSYEALIGGYADYALADMTGGVPAQIRLDGRDMKPKIRSGELWSDLVDWQAHGLMGCAYSIRKKGSHAVEGAHKGGVLAGHAYSVLELVEAGGQRLLHLRNPWGMREWTGDWSDGHELWDDHPEVAEACSYTGPVDDGCFWISFKDFASTFNTLYVVRLLERDDGWLVERRAAEWTPENAGGCVNNRGWQKNTQFMLELEEDSEAVISVMQPDARYHVHQGPKWNKYDNPIGLVLLDHDWGSTSRVRKCTKFSKSKMKGFTAPFKAQRNMTVTVDLSAGKYVVLPCTFKPGGLGQYWVSVYAKCGLKLLGGTEVQFDETLDEDEEAADLEGEEIGVKEQDSDDDEMGEELDDPEERAVRQLTEAVYQLNDLVIALTKRKEALLERVNALESR